jgi:hypothetical protein
MGHHGTFAGNDWHASSVRGIYIVLTYAEFFLTSRRIVWKSNDASQVLQRQKTVHNA